jgi:hypothetical protein
MPTMLRFETLEARDNPSGPEIIDPTGVATPPHTPTVNPVDAAANTASTPSAGGTTQTIIDTTTSAIFYIW